MLTELCAREEAFWLDWALGAWSRELPGADAPDEEVLPAMSDEDEPVEPPGTMW